MQTKPIQDLYSDQIRIYNLLMEAGEISLASSISAVQAKSLAIMAASYLENHLTNLVEAFFHVNSRSPMLVNFAKTKGIERQYHTWFDWKNSSVSPFFRLFGDDCLENFKAASRNDPKLKLSSENFIYIGSLRNNIVHNNFITYNIVETIEDVYQKFELSRPFVVYCNSMFEVQ